MLTYRQHCYLWDKMLIIKLNLFDKNGHYALFYAIMRISSVLFIFLPLCLMLHARTLL